MVLALTSKKHQILSYSRKCQGKRNFLVKMKVNGRWMLTIMYLFFSFFILAYQVYMCVCKHMYYSFNKNDCPFSLFRMAFWVRRERRDKHHVLSNLSDLKTKVSIDCYLSKIKRLR